MTIPQKLAREIEEEFCKPGIHTVEQSAQKVLEKYWSRLPERREDEPNPTNSHQKGFVYGYQYCYDAFMAAFEADEPEQSPKEELKSILKEVEELTKPEPKKKKVPEKMWFTYNKDNPTLQLAVKVNEIIEFLSEGES